jgi:membrane fusion protein, heavy metal efflux system
MKKTIVITIAAAFAALGGLSLVGNSGESSGHESEHAHDEEEVDLANIPLSYEQIHAAELATAPIEYRDMDRTVRCNGQLVVRAHNTAEVSSTMPGIVHRLLVAEGDAVRKGQLVATVENPEVVALQREYYSVCREAAVAESELSRQNYLASQGAGLGKNLQQAEAQHSILAAKQKGLARQLAQAGISAADAAAGKFTTTFPLHAPIAGTVGEITAKLGSYVDMQTSLMRISDNSKVECDLNVFEKDLDKISVGARVRLSLTNHEGRTFSGHVSGMNGSFTEGEKSVAVHVKLDSAAHNLFGGMYVTALVSTGTEKVQAVPSNAIVRDGNRTYVFVHNVNHSLSINKTHHFRRYEVKTGVSDGGYTQIDFAQEVDKKLPVVTAGSCYLASAVGEHGEHNH